MSRDMPAWAADRPLPDELALALITSQVPGLAPVRLAARNAGWDNEAVEIKAGDGAAWVFRFPKRADGVAPFEREQALLPLVAPRLPLPVPDYQRVGRPTAGFPYPFAGYARLPGRPASEFSGPERLPLADIAAAIGKALTALHSTPVADALALGMPVSEDAADWVPDALNELEDVQAVLDAQAPAGAYDRCRAFLNAHRGFRRPTNGDCLLHNDFSADHLLLDPSTGVPTAIIDWTDAEIGDTAFDFGYWWIWQGDVFVQAILRHYRHSHNPGVRRDSGFLDRVRLYGLCGAISDLHYGLEADRESSRRVGLRALITFADAHPPAA